MDKYIEPEQLTMDLVEAVEESDGYSWVLNDSHNYEYKKIYHIKYHEPNDLLLQVKDGDILVFCGKSLTHYKETSPDTDDINRDRHSRKICGGCVKTEDFNDIQEEFSE